MPKKTQDLHQFLIEELQDLYDAEKQLVKSLPRMAKAATNEELKSAITEHLEVTKARCSASKSALRTWNRRPRANPVRE